MDILTNVIVPIVIAVIAMLPFQTWAQYKFKQHQQEDAMAKLLKGVAYMSILHGANTYETRGWISSSELEVMTRHLIEPYFAAGFNGTAEKIVKGLHELPSRREYYTALGDLAKLDA